MTQPALKAMSMRSPGCSTDLTAWTRRVAAIVAVLAEKKLVAEEDRHDLIRDYATL